MRMPIVIIFLLVVILPAILFSEVSVFLLNPFYFQKAYANGLLCIDFIPISIPYLI